jgi:hypothetical protein
VALPIIKTLFLILEPAFFGAAAFPLMFAHAHLYVENRRCGDDVIERHLSLTREFSTAFHVKIM